MDLRRHGFFPDYYICNNGHEVDFFLDAAKQQHRELIQVCWDLSDEKTRQRELRALTVAMNETGVKRGTIVTWFHEETGSHSINIIPLWKWLIQRFKGDELESVFRKKA